MATENLASKSLYDTNLSAGELIVRLEEGLLAKHAIEEGGDEGLIRSLEDVSSNEQANGLMEYIPGDTDLDVRSTLMGKMPVAEATTVSQEPRKLHVVIERGGRYEGATGTYPLRGLARVTFAMAALTAEKAGASFQARAASETVSVAVDDSHSEAYMALRNYDEFVRKSQDLSKPQAKPDNVLAKAIEDLINYDDDIQPQNDAVLVVSDFLAGKIAGAGKSVKDFTWAKPLKQLHNMMGDRLYAIKLVDPAQKALPPSRGFNVTGKTLGLDTADYMRAATDFAEIAQAKALCIDGILKNMRTLELRTQSKSPAADLRDFMFGPVV